MILANQIKLINHQIFLSFTYAEFAGSRALIKASKPDIIMVHENLNPTWNEAHNKLNRHYKSKNS